MLLSGKSSRTPARKHSTPRAHLSIESLETRLVPYALSGSAWLRPEVVTIGIVPDGTDLGGVQSNLISNFNNRFGLQSSWMSQIMKAAQVWAQQTNLNFALIADSGAGIGAGQYQQGDPLMADIRIGGYNFGTTTLAQAYLPNPANNFSIAGDIQFNTNQTWVIGTTGGYDLFTVAMHEIGHSLGLYHSTNYFASMYPGYAGARTGLGTDDISGIRASYSNNQARAVDSFDGGTGNNTFATATEISSLINPINKVAVAMGRDITTTTDADFFSILVPSGTSGQMTIQVQSTALSSLAPSLKVYNNSQALIGEVTALGSYSSATLTLNFSGVTAGTRYYIRVGGTDATAFSTGQYALVANFGAGPTPFIAPPSTLTLNGSPLSSGGGTPVEDGIEFVAPSTTTDTQTTARGYANQAVAMDSAGNYVLVWSSYNQDGEGAGVYAQRYNAQGQPVGSEFQVNTTTAGDQNHAVVAMNAAGDFVIVWEMYSPTIAGGIYAQRYNSEGVAQGGEIILSSGEEWEKTFPSVAMDEAGNFVATWTSYGQNGDNYDTYARRFGADGTTLGDEFLVNSTVTGHQMYSSVAMNAAGEFVITWSSNEGSVNGWDVYARNYNAQGQAIGDEYRVNETVADDQMNSSVSIAPNGNFVITWASFNQDGNSWGVYARLYTPQQGSQAREGEFQVNADGAGNQQMPAVAMNSAGYFVVTWSSNIEDGYNFDVYARFFNPQGYAHADEFIVNTTALGDQHQSSVAISPTGDFVIVWNGEGPGDQDGVFVQRYFVEFPDENGGVGEGLTPDGCDHGHGHDHDEGCGCSDCVAALSGEINTLVHENPLEESTPIEPVLVGTEEGTWYQTVDVYFAIALDDEDSNEP